MEKTENRDEQLATYVTPDEKQATRRAAFFGGYRSVSEFVYEELFRPAVGTKIFLGDEAKALDESANGNTPAAEKVPA